MGIPINSNVNFDPDNKSVYKDQPSKNFEKVKRKERGEERQQDSGKKFKPIDESDVKAEFDEAFASSNNLLAGTPHTELHTTIFDLDEGEQQGASLEEGEIEEITLKQIPPEMQKESLSALFEGLGTKEKLASMQKEVISHKSVDINPADEKPNFSTVFAREQPDLTSINPFAGLQTATIEAGKSVSDPMRTNMVEMQELFDQVESQITILSNSKGQTDTTLTLKQPPIFEGASLTVSTDANARGQFNITFENLNPTAKHLIDMTDNQNTLRNNLEQKGYMVHIVIATTTTVENSQVVKAEQFGARRDDDSQGQGREKDEEQEG